VTKRVAVITTGECERLALGPSLHRVFPEAEFEMLPKADSFTSADLSRPTPISRTKTPREVQKLARKIVAAVEDSPPPDLVLAVDDLELINEAHPGLVVEHLRDAVAEHLRAIASDRPMATGLKLADRVRARCSFHLLAPMVESYFFGEPAALTRAGSTRASQVDPTIIDVEAFVTTDADYLARPHSVLTGSWAKPRRERHPKLYLKFLCDPTDQRARSYIETKSGCAALATLDWRAVHATQHHVRFARSMFVDLAHGLDVPPPFLGDTHPATSRFSTAAVLRNL